MIDKTKAHQATVEDSVLLRMVHPAGSRILEHIGKKWRLKKIPVIGTVISDAALIREIYLDKERFTKIGDGASSALWTPIIGEYGLVNMDGDTHLTLKRHLAPAFSNRICPEIVNRVFDENFTQRLLDGEAVDVVEEVSRYAYKTLWEIIGLPHHRFSEENFAIAVKTLRSVTEGITVTKKKLSPQQVEMAQAKLLFVEELAREAYREATDSTSIPGLMKQEGYDEEAAISVVKALMITGTETIISFIPRMTALFIKSGYLDHLTTEPSHLNQGINEALRVTVPTPVAARVVKEDTVFHGVSLKAGERLVLSTVEACRRYGDFNPFQEVDKNVRGLWFGAGVHLCIGLPLAMAEAERFANSLISVHKEKPLTIVEQVGSKKGHTGSYKKLIIQCQTS